MFDKAEQEQLQLSEKKRMVEADKAKIHKARVPPPCNMQICASSFHQGSAAAPHEGPAAAAGGS